PGKACRRWAAGGARPGVAHPQAASRAGRHTHLLRRARALLIRRLHLAPGNTPAATRPGVAHPAGRILAPARNTRAASRTRAFGRVGPDLLRGIDARSRCG